MKPSDIYEGEWYPVLDVFNEEKLDPTDPFDAKYIRVMAEFEELQKEMADLYSKQPRKPIDLTGVKFVPHDRPFVEYTKPTREEWHDWLPKGLE